MRYAPLLQHIRYLRDLKAKFESPTKYALAFYHCKLSQTRTGGTPHLSTANSSDGVPRLEPDDCVKIADAIESLGNFWDRLMVDYQLGRLPGNFFKEIDSLWLHRAEKYVSLVEAVDIVHWYYMYPAGEAASEAGSPNGKSYTEVEPPRFKFIREVSDNSTNPPSILRYLLLRSTRARSFGSGEKGSPDGTTADATIGRGDAWVVVSADAECSV
jgi:hypothetical protein